MNKTVRTRLNPRKGSVSHENIIKFAIKSELIKSSSPHNSQAMASVSTNKDLRVPQNLQKGIGNAVKDGKISSKDRKMALQQDVDRLKNKLRHEENIHKALERALNRPLGALPRLPPYLPPYTLGLVAEVAVLEEEIRRLEEKVLYFRQNLHQEAVYMSSSKMKLEHSEPTHVNNANTNDSTKLSNVVASATRPKTTFPEDRQGKEIQSFTHSYKLNKQSICKGQMAKIPIDNKSLQKCSEPPKKQQQELLRNNRLQEIPQGDESPNTISENIVKCLTSILLRMSTPPLRPLKSKNCIEGTEFLDPYGILEFGNRDIGPYKQLSASIEAHSFNPTQTAKSLFLLHRLKVLLRKLAFVNIENLKHQEKLAFWINIYNSCMMNAFIENGIPKSPEMVVALMQKATINVDGQLLNATTIEHCIFNNIVIAFDGKQTVVDKFENIKVKWNLVEKSNNDEENGFVLSFDEKHRDKVMEKYLPHVLSTYEAIKDGHKTLKIHSMQSGPWKQSDLNHPASFDSLALEPDLKKAIIDDLDRFLRRKNLYKKVGKPWKRGYLLYGPPGTGKSSLIAAMAKYLKFDVYDLDLSSVHSNSQLMRAMRETSNRSIIVFEDIDCNSEVLDRSKPDKFANLDSDSDLIDKVTMPKRFTLSGLLNYMDGLWSSCGEERILIFTTNHKDKVDSALLRPGRMDMHIHLSFLKAKAFRILASNYLDIEEHHQPLLEQIDELLEKVEVTPAVVAEYLLRNEDPDVALKEIVKFLQELDIPKVIVDEE